MTCSNNLCLGHLPSCKHIQFDVGMDMYSGFTPFFSDFTHLGKLEYFTQVNLAAIYQGMIPLLKKPSSMGVRSRREVLMKFTQI